MWGAKHRTIPWKSDRHKIFAANFKRAIDEAAKKWEEANNYYLKCPKKCSITLEEVRKLETQPHKCKICNRQFGQWDWSKHYSWFDWEVYLREIVGLDDAGIQYVRKLFSVGIGTIRASKKGIVQKVCNKIGVEIDTLWNADTEAKKEQQEDFYREIGFCVIDALRGYALGFYARNPNEFFNKLQKAIFPNAQPLQPIPDNQLQELTRQTFGKPDTKIANSVPPSPPPAPKPTPTPQQQCYVEVVTEKEDETRLEEIKRAKELAELISQQDTDDNFFVEEKPTNVDDWRFRKITDRTRRKRHKAEY